VSLILHGHNTFIGVVYFKRTAAKCYLETWSVAAVLAWLHGTITDSLRIRDHGEDELYEEVKDTTT